MICCRKDLDALVCLQRLGKKDLPLGRRLKLEASYVLKDNLRFCKERPSESTRFKGHQH